MPPSKVSVMNRALFALGQEEVADLSIASLNSSNAATKLLRVIDAQRDLVLERHGWQCALEYDKLTPAQLPGYANWRYPFVYQTPAGCLLVWEIEEHRFCPDVGWGHHGARWEVGEQETDIGSRKIIRSVDGEALRVAFVTRRKWEGLSRHVAEAIALKTAAAGAKSVTGSADATLEANAEKAVIMAQGQDGTQIRGGDTMGPSRPSLLRHWGAF